MRTDELINALAADVPAVNASRVERRFYLKLLAGAVPALVAVLFLGLRPDLGAAWQLPMFWTKLLLPASVTVAALVALHRLTHPGMRLGSVLAAVAVPVAAVWMLAGAVLLAAPAQERPALVFGETWFECPVTITLLSLPALALAFRAARELAPTRLSLAGGAAGLFAGAAAAFAYALHCPETQPPFLAVWYVLGMSIPTVAGALLGRRLLRW